MKHCYSILITLCVIGLVGLTYAEPLSSISELISSSHKVESRSIISSNDAALTYVCGHYLGAATFGTHTDVPERSTPTFFLVEYQTETGIVTNYLVDEGVNSGSECIGLRRAGQHIYMMVQFNGSSIAIGQHTVHTSASNALQMSSIVLIEFQPNDFSKRLVQELVATPLDDGSINAVDFVVAENSFFITGNYWGRILVGPEDDQLKKLYQSTIEVPFVLQIDHHAKSTAFLYNFVSSPDEKNIQTTALACYNDTTVVVVGNSQSLVIDSHNNESWNQTVFFSRLDIKKDTRFEQTYRRRMMANSVRTITGRGGKVPSITIAGTYSDSLRVQMSDKAHHYSDPVVRAVGKQDLFVTTFRLMDARLIWNNTIGGVDANISAPVIAPSYESHRFLWIAGSFVGKSIGASGKYIHNIHPDIKTPSLFAVQLTDAGTFSDIGSIGSTGAQSESIPSITTFNKPGKALISGDSTFGDSNKKPIVVSWFRSIESSELVHDASYEEVETPDSQQDSNNASQSHSSSTPTWELVLLYILVPTVIVLSLASGLGLMVFIVKRRSIGHEYSLVHTDDI